MHFLRCIIASYFWYTGNKRDIAELYVIASCIFFSCWLLIMHLLYLCVPLEESEWKKITMLTIQVGFFSFFLNCCGLSIFLHSCTNRASSIVFYYCFERSFWACIKGSEQFCNIKFENILWYVTFFLSDSLYTFSYAYRNISSWVKNEHKELKSIFI